MFWVRAWSAMGQAIHMSVGLLTCLGELPGESLLRDDVEACCRGVRCLCGSPF